MSQETPDWVTTKDLWEKLEDYPNRRELRLTVGLALVIGQTLAALIGGIGPNEALDGAEAAVRLLVL